MNKKKRFAAVVLVMAMVVIAAGSAYASKSKDYRYSNVDAYVHGYVDFASYFLGAKTKVWCNVSLGGADRAAVSAKYWLKTDKKKIASNKPLNCYKPAATYDGRSGGMRASYGKLIIKYDNKTKELKDKK